MSLIKQLSVTTSIQEANSILNKLGAKPAVRKLVETSIALRQSNDINQRNHGHDFINTAIKELEPEEEPEIPESPGVKTKGDGFVKEELLSNHNASGGNTGSDQSTENTEPYTGEGTDASNSDIESMQTAQGENQMKEGMPSPFPGMMPGMEMMDPNIAAQMAPQMQPMPPMNPQQQMQQMQYTLKVYHNKFVKPLLETIKSQKRELNTLRMEVKETTAKTGKLTLELPKSKTRGFIQETIPTNVNGGMQQQQQIGYTSFDKNNARQEIMEMNNHLNDSYIQ